LSSDDLEVFEGLDELFDEEGDPFGLLQDEVREVLGDAVGWRSWETMARVSRLERRFRFTWPW